MNTLKTVLLATALTVGSAGLALAQVGVDGSTGTQSGAQPGTTGSTDAKAGAKVNDNGLNANAKAKANANANAQSKKPKGDSPMTSPSNTNR
jgi:hypothetical protein